MSNFSTKKRKQPLKDDFDSDETNVADSSTPVHTEKKQKKSNTAVKRTNTDWSKREAVEKKFSTALEPIVTEYLQGLAAISSRTDGSKKSGVLSTASGATSAVGKAVKKVAKNVLEKNALFREAETKEFASADPKFWQILASTEGGKQLADTFVICYDAKHGTVVDEGSNFRKKNETCVLLTVFCLFSNKMQDSRRCNKASTNGSVAGSATETPIFVRKSRRRQDPTATATRQPCCYRKWSSSAYAWLSNARSSMSQQSLLCGQTRGVCNDRRKSTSRQVQGCRAMHLQTSRALFSVESSKERKRIKRTCVLHRLRNQDIHQIR